MRGKKLLVALSGGVDSVVLLHYLHQHYPDNLSAIHVNHHLSKHCNEWQDFCQTLCESLRIEYKSVDIFLDEESNVEENARKKRYHALSDNLAIDAVLCTAHHQNDQAETVLLQLLRGSGMAGLSAMPTIKPLGKGVHYRPLLAVEKSSIVDYAKKHKLRWIEDDSNANTYFRRNFLRLEILPKLSEVYKGLTKTLARAAKNQSESLQLSQDLALIDIKNHQIINEYGRISTIQLGKLNTHRIKNILRFHLNSLDFLMPSDKSLTQILTLINAKADATPLVTWGDYEIRRYQNQLYFINKQISKALVVCPLYESFKGLPGFSVRYRTEGQRVTLEGKTHSQSLKKILQAANIPPWERDQIRLYYINETLRAIEKIGNTC